MAQDDVTIETSADWSKFHANDLDTIIDPMVFRAGDIFLRGCAGASATDPTGNSEKIWRALSSDIRSVQAFFDQLILADRLPLIDYQITRESILKHDIPWVCQVVNEELNDRVIYTVKVWGQASNEAAAR